MYTNADDKAKKNICVVHVTRPTLQILLPTLNFFLQIPKLEQNSGTK